MSSGLYKTSKIAFLALAISLAANAASAQNAAAVVKERQEIMKSLFPLLRGASQVAKGESTDVASIPAKTQEAVAAVQKFASLFPTGSGRENVPDTRATPAVWTEKAAFDAAIAKLVAETQKLGDVAKTGNVDAVKTQWTAASEACGGCHGGPSKSGGKFRFEAQ